MKTARKSIADQRSAVGRRNEPVLLLGGAGYLGSVLLSELLAAGWRVRVLDSFMFGERPLDPFRSHANCELVRGDVRDLDLVAECMKGCQAIIHLAAIVGDSACEENQQLAVEVNRAATPMLRDVALQCKVRRFIFASSCSVYGASDCFANEDSPVNPLSMYAEMKVASERALLEAKSSVFAPVILRLATLFGLSPRMRFDLVVNLLVARAAVMRSIAILNGTQWRPLLHVRDAARAVISSLQVASHQVSGEIFNTGSSGLNLQMEQLGHAVTKAAPGTAVEVLQNDDRRNYRVSFDKIRGRLGFRCRKSVQDGIQEIYGAIRAGSIDDFTAARFHNQFALRALALAGARQAAALDRPAWRVATVNLEADLPPSVPPIHAAVT